MPATPTGPAGRRWRRLIPLAVATASLSTCAGAALAGGGGVGAPAPPEVTDVACLETCAGVRKATVGSRVEVRGRHLENVAVVKFNARDGGRVAAEPIAAAAGSVKAIVPEGAITGRPRVVDSYQAADNSPVELAIVGPGEIESGEFKLDEASATPRKTYFDGLRSPKVTYVFEGDGTTDVRIEVVRRTDGQVVRSWVQEDRKPFTSQQARWDGRKDGGGKARGGKYRFRIGAVSGGKAETTDDARFSYYHFKFPVRGPHSYGDGIGAGRGHRGQDVFADCGVPIVAARGGRVQWRAYQAGGAGYYLVIDGKGTKMDYVYMHLKKPSPFGKGDRVHTGQRIGKNGASGNATGCHLHFEIWSAPGWYEGGHFTNPTDDLREWDSWS